MTTGEYTTTLGVQDLLDAGLHFGHQTKRWNPKMKRYIFGARNGIYIIDLDKSLFLLKEAAKFAYDTAIRGRSILFVGTKKQSQEAVKAAAERSQQPYMVNRWLGGTLTNLLTIRKSVARLRELDGYEKDGSMEKFPKKEVARMRHELEKLNFNLSGIAKMGELPGALFVIDTNRKAIAVAEAVRLKIPVIAVCDTNSDPEHVDYPIPGNDDAIRAIKLVVDVIAEAVERGHAEYSKVAAEEAKRKAAEHAAQEAKAKAGAAARAASPTPSDGKAPERRVVGRKPRAVKEATEAAPAAETPAPEAPAAEGTTPAQS